ncbi:MAG TPA: hypothetical protein VGQ46_03865 [Thermoanaerobaculia bacterium]|nr:hypothetical protein [Thermoanaerobaculia bacterium]
MVNWTNFDPAGFDLQFNEAKLAPHDITVDEAAEVLWNGFLPLRISGVTIVIGFSAELTLAGLSN